jgi:hypothetical protein
MGPSILFDKSFLQSLSVDESVWFDHFFGPVVCPLLYIETLADLSKDLRTDRTPEQEVGIIAAKTPQMSGAPVAPHHELCVAELLGHRVPINGQVPVRGARMVKDGDEVGAVIPPSPESKAFTRWQAGRFGDVEREFASEWRAQLANVDLTLVATSLRSLGIANATCPTLEDARKLASAVIADRSKPFDRMNLAFAFLGIPAHLQREILARWSLAGYAPLPEHAPYTAFVLTVELFFHIAMAANLIATTRPSHRIDIAYLFYLPFCRVFVSHDKLHAQVAPLFLRREQVFMPGDALKRDLKRINDHFARLPDETKEQGLHAFASSPPGEPTDPVVSLWDHVAPGWRNPQRPLDPEKAPAEMLAKLKRLRTGDGTPVDRVVGDGDLDSLTIERRVSRKKGNWWQLGKDVDYGDDE